VEITVRGTLLHNNVDTMARISFGSAGEAEPEAA